MRGVGIERLPGQLIYPTEAIQVRVKTLTGMARAPSPCRTQALTGSPPTFAQRNGAPSQDAAIRRYQEPGPWNLEHTPVSVCQCMCLLVAPQCPVAQAGRERFAHLATCLTHMTKRSCIRYSTVTSRVLEAALPLY